MNWITCNEESQLPADVPDGFVMLVWVEERRLNNGLRDPAHAVVVYESPYDVGWPGSDYIQYMLVPKPEGVNAPTD